MAAVCSEILQKLEEFVEGDMKKVGREKDRVVAGSVPSLLSGSLSLALCCILYCFFFKINTLVLQFDVLSSLILYSLEFLIFSLFLGLGNLFMYHAMLFIMLMILPLKVNV